MKIIGNNFGTTQNTGDKIYISPPHAYKDSLGLEQEVINTWSNTAIVFRVWAYPAWEDTIKYIWVMKNGEKSNAYKFEILK